VHSNQLLFTNKSPEVYFIVINWNQYALTRDCLVSLQDQDYKDFQVIIVDNGSTDGSVDRLENEFDNFFYIKLPENIGYSPGNNAGIEYALSKGADYIFLLNNDTIVDRQMLSLLMRVSESSDEIGIVGPTMYFSEPQDKIWAGENVIDWKKANIIRKEMGEQQKFEILSQNPPVEVDYIDTCAILIKNNVFSHIGEMDGKYFINFDDLDLNVRSQRAGFKIVYVPAARMWHRVSSSMGFASPATTYYMTRNSLLFFWSYAPGLWKIIDVLLIFARTIRTILAWNLKPGFRNNDQFRRKSAANIFALRDFCFGRFGKMGQDVREACYPYQAPSLKI